MKVLQKLFLILSVCLITSCNDSILDAKELVLKDCKSTGQTFIATEQICTTMSRGCSEYKDVQVQYYVYQCPDDGRVLSKYKLEYKNY